MFWRRGIHFFIVTVFLHWAQITFINLAEVQSGARIRFRLTSSIRTTGISINDINNAIRQALDDFQKIEVIEKELLNKGFQIRKGTTEARHQAFFGRKHIPLEMSKNGFIATATLSHLIETFNMRNKGMTINMQPSIIGYNCPDAMTCKETKYRTADGSCNNLKHPHWGKSFTTFTRMLPPRYADGVTHPRIASDGGPLPEAREVSTMAIPDTDVPNRFFTLALMQWAQFIDHDLTLTAITKTSEGRDIQCCHPEIQRNSALQHPACFPISIPKNDNFYSQYHQTCMDFVRSLPATNSDCIIGHREQLNQLTSYLDASNVYGSTESETRELRSFGGGRMKVSSFNGVDMLPKQTENTQECEESKVHLECFKAGDERVNEGISLAVMHTIWVREHNRIAKELQRINPGWSDEIIFQETRRIIAAEIQHITYSEDLPLLLGKAVMNEYGLNTLKIGYSNSYDWNVDSSIINAFASAAYRFGHTLVQGNIHLMNESGSVFDKRPLFEQFFNPLTLYRKGYLDGHVRGFVQQPSQTYDKFITHQLTNHLYQTPNKGYGFDLVALNIQRARDHGIPGYNDWRQRCGFNRLKHFGDLVPIMGSYSANAFRKLYRSVDDIDLFPAGISERSVKDGTLGPTFACIIGEQFKRLKIGDRYWYENGGMRSSFSSAQLQEIRKSTLARILCDNSDDVRFIQRQAFQKYQRWNPKVECKGPHIPRINLNAWKGEQV